MAAIGRYSVGAIFCSCVFALALGGAGAVQVQPHGVAVGPLNTAVDLSVSTTTVLDCEATDDQPTSRISWTEYVTSSAGSPISDNENVLGGHPNGARYAIDWDGNRTYDLVIEPTLLEDGGAYRCIDINDASVPHFAQLITILGAPNCTTNIPVNGYVLEHQYYTIECNVYYQGNVAPTMTWTGPDGFKWATTVSASTVWAGANINVTRYNEQQAFDLTVAFTEDGFLQDDYASNVPTLSYSVSTAPLTVQWGPKNIYYVPEQASYEIGTTIECHADSNPSSNFFWQNMATNERWDDYRLHTYDDLIGTQTMWCHAQNQIGNNVYSADLFFNLTVNPRTTTTPAPSTTPTTTAPAQAECDDVTGRWTATTPHKVEMCLEVDSSGLGRVLGILRNETDSYFIDIRGKMQEDNYSQFGFTGIWPVNIGSVSFTATCQKCHGTESLWLSAIGRKTTDNPSCYDFNVPWFSPSYEFFRTGPPCRGRSGQLEW
jgi:hypothetical protein